MYLNHTQHKNQHKLHFTEKKFVLKEQKNYAVLYQYQENRYLQKATKISAKMNRVIFNILIEHMYSFTSQYCDIVIYRNVIGSK